MSNGESTKHCEKQLPLKWSSFRERSNFPQIWFRYLRLRIWGLEIKHLNAHNFAWQGCFFFHYYLATSTTDWAQIFTGLVFYALCWEPPSEKTGLWQLPIVFIVFKLPTKKNNGSVALGAPLHEALELNIAPVAATSGAVRDHSLSIELLCIVPIHYLQSNSRWRNRETAYVPKTLCSDLWCVSVGFIGLRNIRERYRNTWVPGERVCHCHHRGNCSHWRHTITNGRQMLHIYIIIMYSRPWGLWNVYAQLWLLFTIILWVSSVGLYV